MRAGEKFCVDYLKIDCSKKRAFVGMSTIENADVTLRMPSALAELAEEDFFNVVVYFIFVVFPKTKMIYFLFSCASL